MIKTGGMNTFLFYFILIIGIGKSYICAAQNEKNRIVEDSLETKTFEELQDKFQEYENDVNIATVYAKAYLEKAKSIGDTLKMADGFYFLALIFDQKNAMKYTDSVINLTDRLIHKEYPGVAHKLRGNLFFIEGEYNKAFDEYLVATKYAKRSGNELQYLTLKFNIGILKNQIGERDEALLIFRDYVNYLMEKDLKGDSHLYNRGLYALSESYTYNRKLDSAEIYIKEGIAETLKTKDSVIYNLFVLQSGVNFYYQNKYNRAIDSLLKSEERLVEYDNDKLGIAICNYYIGKSLIELDSIEKGVYQLEKVDAILNEVQDVTPELIDTYDVLRKHYESKDDHKNQLKYVTAQLYFDSILKQNYKSLSNKIIRNYESNELLDQKNQLINKLKENTFFSKKVITAFSIITLILLGTIFFVFRKNWIYKIRFQSLIDQIEKNKEKPNEENVKLATKNIDLPEELIKEVLDKLKKFEESKRFLNHKYTLTSLAKELNTNSTYLSKIINETKQINFANYLNDLRVEGAIERLTKEKKFRAYTIKTIANEVGFNTAQSFSLAFYKKTGIYPSYFIKKIDSQED